MSLDWIGLETFPERYWAEATPEVERTEWTSPYVTPRKVADNAAEAVIQYLSKVPEGIDYISCRTLKPAAGLAKMTPKGFFRARKEAAGRLTGWTYDRSRRGYCRCAFA